MQIPTIWIGIDYLLNHELTLMPLQICAQVLGLCGISSVDCRLTQNLSQRYAPPQVGSRIVWVSLSSHSVKAAIWWWTPPSKPETHRRGGGGKRVGIMCMMLRGVRGRDSLQFSIRMDLILVRNWKDSLTTANFHKLELTEYSDRSHKQDEDKTILNPTLEDEGRFIGLTSTQWSRHVTELETAKRGEERYIFEISTTWLTLACWSWLFTLNPIRIVFQIIYSYQTLWHSQTFEEYTWISLWQVQRMCGVIIVDIKDVCLGFEPRSLREILNICG